MSVHMCTSMMTSCANYRQRFSLDIFDPREALCMGLNKEMPKAITRSTGDSNAVTKALLDLVSRIPTTDEPTSSNPNERAQSLARTAALQAAGVSAAMALPPGPFGLATIIPDLIAIWRLQQSMVADIAAVFGKTRLLKKELMIYCLFKHAGAALMRDLVVRVGERFLVRRTALKTIQQILQRVGVRITQRVIGKGISRWIPVVGALGVGAYAYYDTMQVASTTIELFSTDIDLEATREQAGQALLGQALSRGSPSRRRSRRGVGRT